MPCMQAAEYCRQTETHKTRGDKTREVGGGGGGGQGELVHIH